MKQPNAAQKRFLQDVCKFVDELGLSYLYQGYLDRPYQIHHVVGRSAKQNKIYIGHWFILPVPVELHDVASNHPHNVTHHKHSFKRVYGTQVWLYMRMVECMRSAGLSVPTDDILNAIYDTKE